MAQPRCPPKSPSRSTRTSGSGRRSPSLSSWPSTFTSGKEHTCTRQGYFDLVFHRSSAHHYGALILGYGLYELTGTGQWLANYHAPVWWGAIIAGARPVLRRALSPGPQRLIQTADIRSKLSGNFMTAQRTMTFGMVVGNRGFFPDHLAKTGREEIIAVLEAAGAKAWCWARGLEVRRGGNLRRVKEVRRAVQETCGGDRRHHRHAAQLWRRARHCGRDPLSGLKVPVLVQATPDRSDNMTIAVRRDSFCGKMSACNNLMQYGIPTR
jgi:hypothetical protein